MAPGGEDHYRWEDSPGLSHHCGICKRPLANPTALQSCIGVHVEPCKRFHQQLHFIRKSHDCSSCHIGVEMHRKRHREILTSVHFLNLEHQKRSQTQAENQSDAVTKGATSSQNVFGDTRRERKRKRKSIPNGTRMTSVEIFTEADYVLVSEALYGKTTWGRGGAGSCEDGVSSKNPEDKETKSATTPEGNRKAAKAESTVKRLRKAGGKDSTSSPSPVATDPLLGIDPKIFQRLGIRISGHKKWPKVERDELKKLATTIALDLDITEKEDQEFEVRRAGFFRFVNRKTAATLDELHEQFSWSTGEIKKPAKA